MISGATVAANVAGALVVIVLTALVLPLPEAIRGTDVVGRNVLAGALYLAVAVPLGLWLGLRRARPIGRWLLAETPADDRIREHVLRLPQRLLGMQLALWGIAVVVFYVSNFGVSRLAAFEVAITVALGGITTASMAYLLTERAMRPITRRVLRGTAPRSYAVPGVATRTMMAWGLGTAVPVLGTVVLAAFVLALPASPAAAARSTIVLGATALVVGFLAILMVVRQIAASLLLLRTAMEQVESGDLDVDVLPDDASEVGFLQAGFNRMVAGLRERERIRDAFGAYVDHDVARHLLDGGVRADGEEVEVTVLFLDVRDFTGFAERSTAREVVSTINRLFERAVPAIHGHGGHVDKYVGDGLMAVFGAPQAQVDHAGRALAAAREIAAAVEIEFGDALGVGIGLNSGLVVAGSIGGDGRLEFTVIGDTVNTAARVESSTRRTGDTILLTARTLELSGEPRERFVARPGIELKGKREPIGLFAPVPDRAARR